MAHRPSLLTDNYLIDVDNAIIVDVEATTAIRVLTPMTRPQAPSVELVQSLFDLNSGLKLASLGLSPQARLLRTSP